MIPPLQSLVKYDTPVLVSTTTIKKKEKGPGATARGTKKGALPPVEQRPGVTQTEDILNSILPPREWTEDGQLWVQYVSSTPATRLDVINLQEKLDQQVRPPAPAHAAPHPVLPRAPPPFSRESGGFSCIRAEDMPARSARRRRSRAGVGGRERGFVGRGETHSISSSRIPSPRRCPTPHPREVAVEGTRRAFLPRVMPPCSRRVFRSHFSAGPHGLLTG